MAKLKIYPSLMITGLLLSSLYAVETAKADDIAYQDDLLLVSTQEDAEKANKDIEENAEKTADIVEDIQEDMDNSSKKEKSKKDQPKKD